MTMSGVRIQSDIRLDAHLGYFFFDFTDASLNQALGIVGFRCKFILDLRVTEEINRSHSKIIEGLAFPDHFINRQSKLVWHGINRVPDSLAFRDKDRVDELARS